MHVLEMGRLSLFTELPRGGLLGNWGRYFRRKCSSLAKKLLAADRRSVREEVEQQPVDFVRYLKLHKVTSTLNPFVAERARHVLL
jgi:hypothetical protein